MLGHYLLNDRKRYLLTTTTVMVTGDNRSDPQRLAVHIPFSYLPRLLIF